MSQKSHSELLSKMESMNIEKEANGLIKENTGHEDESRKQIDHETVPEFYNKAQKYWSEVPATVNGMLGGLGYINAIDIQGSKVFLRELKIPGKNLALDCGAGIGRVSRNLLIPLFKTVDLVEQDIAFAKKAREFCTADDVRPNSVGEVYNVGLQDFKPTSKYDLIWSQWVLGHLTDQDLVAFFHRIRLGLQPGAYFCIKENVSSSNSIIKDDEDSSVTRPISLYERLLKEAGFRIVRKVKQQNFPKGLFPVYMIACKAKPNVDNK